MQLLTLSLKVPYIRWKPIVGSSFVIGRSFAASENISVLDVVPCLEEAREKCKISHESQFEHF